MLKKQSVAAALMAAFLTTSGDGTPLIVARIGNHIIVATNSIDTNGNSRCKLHFSRNAVVMRATQAASMIFIWPDGRKETIDFDATINDRIKDLDEPVGRLQDILIEDAQERIRTILQRYQPADPDRADIANDLVSEYVLVGPEHNGFLGVRAFTLQVTNPQSITFEVEDITTKLRKGEVVDYTQNEIGTIRAHGQKAVRAAVYALLKKHDEAAQNLGNKAFSPPYLVMDVTHSGRSYLSDPGPCRL